MELFLGPDGAVVLNELAPRPHNSGHLTFDASVTSQFEQQVRAICGLPLGSTKLLATAAAMANLLGELWEHGDPNWAAASRFADVKLHLYGKSHPRLGQAAPTASASQLTIKSVPPVGAAIGNSPCPA